MPLLPLTLMLIFAAADAAYIFVVDDVYADIMPLLSLMSLRLRRRPLLITLIAAIVFFAPYAMLSSLRH